MCTTCLVNILFLVENAVDQPLSTSPLPLFPTETEPIVAVQSKIDGSNIGDIEGLSVKEVAKRLVADALSKAVNQYCGGEDSTVSS